ncbi:alpha-mannosidase [Devosia pacifica]|uniref:Alpha-mannosidase n=1 Tax=Devosia pacifica TaxID=1335967 RepID=A0A918VY87_9HYPH|nr:glycoside hydrolase family 38 C-terminal domain-containing protein [Devosia pacifica]GHA36220.1 alpha-mannosidase [Devosia pacifica]
MNSLASRLGLLVDDVKREGQLLRLCNDLGSKILTPVPGEIAWRYLEADTDAASALAADWRSWAAFDQRTVWSKKQGPTWFAAEVEVPAEAKGKTFVLRFSSQWQQRPGSTDPQCLAYLDGKIAQAIDGNHTELVIERNAKPGNKHIVLVNAFTFFDRPLAGFGVEYLTRHERVEKLYFDLMTPFEVAGLLPQTDARRHAILNLVEEALYSLDRRGQITDELEASLPDAEKIASKIYELSDTEVQPTITAVGHTHLDVGWLWRVMHTRDKTGRSFATVLNLMAEYPGFVFMYNQSVLFNFLKTDYPEIWEGLKEKVKSGQFEIEGAMWVEPDVNIASGEALVRQILRGKRFHQQEFGVTPKCVWLPDTFGYSANLPQIMEKSGLEYFITSKLSWNDTDRHPYDTFFWRGIDGTQTKAQLITAQRFDSDAIFTTYNSDLSVSEVMGAWKRYEPKSVYDEVVLCYGYGDGGGGPTRAMIERGTRLQNGIPGAPKVRMEGIVPFLDRLGKRMTDEAGKFPVWNGELYLQYHRGTLTSIAKNKRNNRIAERRLRELEFVGAMAMATAGTAYPKEALARYWDTLLINQFHDILPGTSIPEVYEDSDAEYGAMFAELDSSNGPFHAALGTLKAPGAKIFNGTSQSRDGELVLIDEVAAGTGKGLVQGGTVRDFQKVTLADGSSRLAAPVPNVPALGWASVGVATSSGDARTSLSVSATHLENDLLRVRFDANGEIVSVFDKIRQREALAEGQTANRLVAYEDKSMNWDAWDIDWYFDKKGWALADGKASIEVVEEGPYRAALRVTREYGKSRFVQVISLADGARQLDFDTFIDWHEQRQVVKALFPFDLNTSELRSEIQFGHVKRATHRNTSWDKARFEASMQRWVDISEADFGAALINDCKYGYDAVEQTVRITLVRGSTHPHPEADQGEHRLRYALFIHEGEKDLQLVHRAAERLNNPLQLVGALGEAAEAAPFSFADVDCDTVTVETVKKAEDSDDLIVRVFEHANRRATAHIQFGVPVKSVSRVNLMEEGGESVEFNDNSLTLSLRPFEIATLKLSL